MIFPEKVRLQEETEEVVGKQGFEGKMQGREREMKEVQQLDVTRLLTPQTGRQFSSTLRQQAMIQPGIERLSLLNSDLLATQLNNRLRKRIQKIWQYRSVSQKLSLQIIPRRYPCNSQLLAVLTNSFIRGETMPCISQLNSTNKVSMTGKRQKKIRVPQIPLMLLTRTLKSWGMASQYTAISREYEKQGAKEFPRVTRKGCFSCLQNNAMLKSMDTTHEIPTKPKSQQYSCRSTKRAQSMANMTKEKTPTPMSFLCHVKGANMSRMTRILAAFHIIQLNAIDLIRVGAVNQGWGTLDTPTMKGETVLQFLEQQYEVIPGERVLRKQIPTQTPKARRTSRISTMQNQREILLVGSCSPTKPGMSDFTTGTISLI